VKHTQLILFIFNTPHFPHRAAMARHPRRRMNVAMWREQDEMRQRAIGSKVIPRRFRDEKEALLPHCGREH
jgi:hypothetical protein